MPRAAPRLFLAWMLLMALSGALALFADVRHDAPLSMLGIAAAAFAALAKCRIVLADYLDLRQAPGALRGFLAAIAAIVLIVAASFAASAALALDFR
ncbi:MAG: hypothetical protein KGM15_04585 [Pseudomonadota bacterium]|nr:hypothetical protein [Pseudomonadota bacterium]